MAYKFKYSELDSMAEEIKNNADAQLDALAELDGQINTFLKTAMSSETASSIKGYYSDFYGTVIPILALLITNHSKNCKLYVKAYDSHNMGGDTAIDVSELQDTQRGIARRQNRAIGINMSNRINRTNSDFVDAMGGSVASADSYFNPIDTARTDIAKHIKKVTDDIDAIENHYKKTKTGNYDYTKEFTANRVAIGNLKVLFGQRDIGGAKIKDYNMDDYWNSESGEKLNQAAVALWYEGEVKKDYFKDTPISDNEYKGYGSTFDERTNGDDLDYNIYYQKPFNECIRNYHGGNCTWYAYGRWAEAQGLTPDDEDFLKMSKDFSEVNAVNFIEVAKKYGLEIGQEPRPGAIMVWGYDGSTDGQPGHVAFVESVDKKGNVKTTESGWSGGRWWKDGYSPDNNYGRSYRNAQFRGFIYPKGSAPVKMTDANKEFLNNLRKQQPKAKLPVETTTKADNIVKSSKEIDVDGQLGSKTSAATQKVLKVKDDSVWGPKTVKAIQKKVGVKQDGKMGPETIKAMQKYLNVKQDGKMGPETSKAWQKFLNEELTKK